MGDTHSNSSSPSGATTRQKERQQIQRVKAIVSLRKVCHQLCQDVRTVLSCKLILNFCIYTQDSDTPFYSGIRYLGARGSTGYEWRSSRVPDLTAAGFLRPLSGKSRYLKQFTKFAQSARIFITLSRDTSRRMESRLILLESVIA